MSASPPFPRARRTRPGRLRQLLSAGRGAGDALSFAASAFTLARIAPTEPPAQGKADGQLAAGGRFILRSSIMRASLLATATVNFFCDGSAKGL
jgi:hypothetical protein